MPKRVNQIWGVIPAAGIGQRMQSDIPKQYLKINDSTVLQHSCERLLCCEQVTGLIVAVREEDEYWQAVYERLSNTTDKVIYTVAGGKERAASVYNALHRLRSMTDTVETDAWTLVHDAVRPCVSQSDIQKLLENAQQDAHGAILATPVRDTMKRATAGQTISTTVEREDLWHALTPQCFPLNALLQALSDASSQEYVVTDESSAMEIAGYTPKLVQASDSNIKITRPGDLQLAKFFLDQR